MPALDESTIANVTERLNRYLATKAGYGEAKYLTAGGSAAVFSVSSPAGLRVFKGFNPKFFDEATGAAERKRLDVQRKLIGHSCPSLIQTFEVVEAEGTAFVEMEYVDYPPLTTVLSTVPDEAVVPLFSQLVDAVKFLDGLGIVHRDIKPENIHVSADFTSLKLLDLGVAREVEQSDAPDGAITDHGSTRPFLATAQYSSPEYLFRLDAPSPRLWKGLNFYQLGAVLHDLIAKQPLFQYEMTLENRWLVARAVLTKVPVFADGNPARLANLKSLASRCLVKDLESRLQLVGWEDFNLGDTKDPLAKLRARLAKGKVNVGGQMSAANASRLAFDRGEFFRRYCEMVRTELLQVCGTDMPLTLRPSAPGEAQVALLLSTVNAEWTVECELHFDWQQQLYERTVNVSVRAKLVRAAQAAGDAHASSRLVAVVTIGINEAEGGASAAGAVAQAVATALDRLEGAGDTNTLHDADLIA
ncbi:protein kinase domain-containing protein [Cupriavidus gilardii]|jgi:serine/threonine-protein kinase|uniref:protein kinase domain-containing protein n=1 Tax=Cupriavidus gilardii TaxID=82541 RepID=UPI00158052AD|nr:protein kinase [Cupriavidus gilardii]MCT9072389.1 protein kinase [Cupriavidus gilardii]QKS64024.1 protein kinase [Cupriavidus gilardii]